MLENKGTNDKNNAKSISLT